MTNRHAPRRYAPRLCAVAVALALTGLPLKQVKADPSPVAVLATVGGGRAITRAEFEQFRAPIVRMTTEDAQTDSALLRSLVDKTVLLMEAVSLGIDREPDFGRRLLQFRETQIARRYSSLMINRKISVSQEEVVQHFHATERDRAIRVAIILLLTREDAVEVLEELEELEEGANFAQLAGERSVHETRDQGGDSGVYYLKDKTSEALKGHIFKLAVDEVSAPLPFYGRWMVIKILDEVPVPLLQVGDIVRGEILQRKMKERTKVVVDSLFAVYAPQTIEASIAHLSQAFTGTVADSSQFDNLVLCTFAGGRVTFENLRTLVPRADFSQADKVDSLVNAVLPLRLFLQEGLRRGIDEDPALQAAVINEREDQLVTRLRKRGVDDRIPEVTLEEARTFYEQHPEKFQTIDTIVITEILVRFRQQAQELRGQIDAGADAAELASIHTIREGSAHHEGRLELTMYDEALLPGRWDIVKEMRVGEVAGPIRVNEGFAIFVVQERRHPTTKPFNTFSQRRAKAYVMLNRSGSEYVEFIRELRLKYGVEVFEENL